MIVGRVAHLKSINFSYPSLTTQLARKNVQLCKGSARPFSRAPHSCSTLSFAVRPSSPGTTTRRWMRTHEPLMIAPSIRRQSFYSKNPLQAVSWVDRTDGKLRPYLQLVRLDKPIGTWLLLWPCWWSLGLANAPFFLYVVFGVGALVMRGAGCTINDMWDRDFDKRVERTRDRPLASGKLTLRQALAFLAAQLTVGLAVLLQLNWYSVTVGAASLLLVVSYPLMKRITYWPQLVLGLTFNWGALLGWAAVKSSLGSIPFLLYTAGIAWTLIYDTIYAHMDKDDDVTVGVRSTALLFGENSKRWFSFFSAVMIGSLAAIGVIANLHWPYFVSVIATAGHLAWQISTVTLNDRSDCMRKFISNKWLGAILFSGILGNNLIG